MKPRFGSQSYSACLLIFQYFLPEQTSVPPPDRTTPSVENSEAHGMCLIQEMLEKQSIPRDTAKIILSCWRDGTKQCMNSYIKRWVQHCLKWVKNPLVHLKMNWLIVSLDFTKRAKESWIHCFEHVAQCCLYTVLKQRLFSGQPCSCPKMFKGHV